MEKFMKVLKQKVDDETAAFAILGAMIITFAVTICAFEYIRYASLSEVNANVDMAQISEENEIVNSYETLENVTSQEDLKKISEEEKEKNNEDDKKETNTNSSPKYYIKVNYGAQVVNIYSKDSNGEYTVPVKAMVCSTGTHTPTSGVYTIGYRWEWLRMIGDVYGHYVTQIYGDILFHSVPYLTKGDHSSIEYWAYDQLGTKASLGCVRLQTKDALWIFNNISSGTKVEFYSSSNPGPLGKPTARKISNAPSYVRGWDPTDPDSRNPWPKYLEELENKKEENNDKNENDKTNEEENNNTNEVETNTIVNDVINDVVNDVTNDTVDNSLSSNMIDDEEQTPIDDKQNNVNDMFANQDGIAS